MENPLEKNLEADPEKSALQGSTRRSASSIASGIPHQGPERRGSQFFAQTIIWGYRLIRRSSRLLTGDWTNAGTACHRFAFICGTQDIHKELERKISEFLGTETQFCTRRASTRTGAVRDAPGERRRGDIRCSQPREHYRWRASEQGCAEGLPAR